MPRPIALRSFLDTVRAERVAKPALVSAGRFNRSAIMREAVVMARSINRRFGSWQVRMRIALKTVWAKAKAAMVEACDAAALTEIHLRAELPVCRERHEFIRRRMKTSTGRVFFSGARAAAHGW